MPEQEPVGKNNQDEKIEDTKEFPEDYFEQIKKKLNNCIDSAEDLDDLVEKLKKDDFPTIANDVKDVIDRFKSLSEQIGNSENFEYTIKNVLSGDAPFGKVNFGMGDEFNKKLEDKIKKLIVVEIGKR